MCRIQQSSEALYDFSLGPTLGPRTRVAAALSALDRSALDSRLNAPPAHCYTRHQRKCYMLLKGTGRLRWCECVRASVALVLGKTEATYRVAESRLGITKFDAIIQSKTSLTDRRGLANADRVG